MTTTELDELARLLTLFRRDHADHYDIRDATSEVEAAVLIVRAGTLQSDLRKMFS